MPHWDQSTFLAKRVKDSEVLGPPEQPTHFVPPGALAAIPHERLNALLDAGHDEAAIVERTNRLWREEHAQRLSTHAQWVSGPYASAIVQMREQAAQKAAEEARRAMLFERFMADLEAKAE